MKLTATLRSITLITSDMDVLLDRWLHFKSDNTRLQYRRVWLSFVAYFEPTEPLEITTAEAFRYVSHLQSLPAQPGRSFQISPRVSPGTVRRSVLILYQFFERLRETKYVTENPFHPVLNQLQAGKTGDRRPTQLIPFEHVQRILARPSASFEGGRDRAFLALLFGGGLRISEAVGLLLSDVVETPEGVSVRLRRTKAGVSALQPVTFGADYVRQYLRVRSLVPCALPQFFVSPDLSRPLTVSTAHRAFKRYCVDAGLPPYSPHCARATVITKLLDSGVSHREVAAFSRHASVQMVERYDKTRQNLAAQTAKKVNF